MISKRDPGEIGGVNYTLRFSAGTVDRDRAGVSRRSITDLRRCSATTPNVTMTATARQTLHAEKTSRC